MQKTPKPQGRNALRLRQAKHIAKPHVNWYYATTFLFSQIFPCYVTRSAGVAHADLPSNCWTFARLRRVDNTYRCAQYTNCVRLLDGIDLEKDDYFRGVDEEGEAMGDFAEGIALLSGIGRCGFTPGIVLDAGYRVTGTHWTASTTT